jgi:hypothetical protein
MSLARGLSWCRWTISILTQLRPRGETRDVATIVMTRLRW